MIYTQLFRLDLANMKGIILLKATLFPYLIYLALNILVQSYLYTHVFFSCTNKAT